MITGISMITLTVKDQDEALRFYTETLGFEKRMDERVGEARWMTVAPKGSSGPEIILHDPRHWMSPERAQEQLDWIGQHPGMVWACDDCRQTIKELEDRGVQVVQQPAERPYGVEAVITDLYGNHYTLVQRAQGLGPLRA